MFSIYVELSGVSLVQEGVGGLPTYSPQSNYSSQDCQGMAGTCPDYQGGHNSMHAPSVSISAAAPSAGVQLSRETLAAVMGRQEGGEHGTQLRSSSLSNDNMTGTRTSDVGGGHRGHVFTVLQHPMGEQAPPSEDFKESFRLSVRREPHLMSDGDLNQTRAGQFNMPPDHRRGGTPETPPGAPGRDTRAKPRLSASAVSTGGQEWAQQMQQYAMPEPLRELSLQQPLPLEQSGDNSNGRLVRQLAQMGAAPKLAMDSYTVPSSVGVSSLAPADLGFKSAEGQDLHLIVGHTAHRAASELNVQHPEQLPASASHATVSSGEGQSDGTAAHEGEVHSNAAPIDAGNPPVNQQVRQHL